MESTQSKASSPAWRNPRDVMRRSVLHRRSRRSLAPSLSAASASPQFASANSPSDAAVASPSSFNSPSINVFRRSPRKRPLSTPKEGGTESKRSLDAVDPDWDDPTANDPFGSPLITSLQHDSSKRTMLDRSKSFNDSLHDLYHLDFSGAEFVGTPKAKEEEYKTSSSLPLDLRIGTKLRIVSKKSFPWMSKSENIKTGNVKVQIVEPDLFTGMRRFVDAQDASDASFTSVSALSFLESSSLCFQYPHIPGTSFYPRMESLNKESRGARLPPTQQEALLTEWEECIASLFASWKKGIRRSFYVCAPFFTVLFTSYRQKEDEPVTLVDDCASQSCFPSVNGQLPAAVVSHTNYALRQLFTKEGIKFELVKKRKRTSLRGYCEDSSPSQIAFLLDDVTNSQPPLLDFGVMRAEGNKESPVVATETVESGATDSEDDPDENSPTKTILDISRAKNGGTTPKLARHSSFDSLRHLDDRRPNTVIIKDGLSLRKLCNLLLNDPARTTRSLSGPLIGVPPTLISAQPFARAHLVSLKKSSQVVRRPNGELEFVCEIEGGAILPEHVHSVSEFIRHAGLAEEETPVIIKVLDRTTFNGLNSVTEKAEEWSELLVTPSCFKWKAVTER